MADFTNSSIKLIWQHNLVSATNHALISITEEIRRALDNDEFACGVFRPFQEIFNACVAKCTCKYCKACDGVGCLFSFF